MTAREITRLQGAAIVLASGVIFSFGPLTFRAIEAATDWQFLAYRGGSVGVVALIGLLIRYRGKTAEIVLYAGPRIWLAGALIGSAFGLFILSIARISVATILLLQTAAPFVAALVGRLVLGEPVRRATWAVMAVAVVGVSIMISGNLEGTDKLGLLLGSGIPLVLGVYSVLVRSAPRTDPMVPVVIAGALAGSVAAFVALTGPGLDLSTRDMGLAFISGGVLIGIGLPMYNFGHRFVPAAEVTLLLMTEVVLAPIWVWIWPGETPTTSTLIGGAVLLLAVTWLALSSDRPQPLAVRPAVVPPGGVGD